MDIVTSFCTVKEQGFWYQILYYPAVTFEYYHERNR